MGKTEVTVEQFRRFVNETGCVTDAEKSGARWTWREPGFRQKDNHPVVYLSFGDAEQYADWAGVDLPTQAEWLYAARAGSDARFYWGGELDGRYVWHRGNSPIGTHPVARKLANAWGLYDVVGNVWEYVKVGEVCFQPCGGSWTRCPEYLTRQGFIAYPLNETLQPRLSKCDPDSKPYPCGDGRGFRCIRRN